ncbi:BAS1 [Candida theae]|uniref:BAS1 n=1 Tax=Candida theae TaxID=1198502 RepID=A0AAD5BEI5_9ASCO|nr:BAS1 [Candida theae]KAI5957680.1 BAS1 [Candida theae]
MNHDDSKNFHNSKKRVVQIDPLEITESLGFQTYRKGVRKPWTKEEDTELSSLVTNEFQQGRDLETIDWDNLANALSSDGLRKGKDCRKRWSNSLDPNLRKGKWTPEEDELLVKAFEKFGSAWLKVAQEIKGRTDDQCAKRYVEVLDPKTKDRLKPWTEEEDLLLIKQVKLNGTKWRTICSAFESRPSLTCRNRWRKLVTEVVRGKASVKIKEAVESVTNGNSSSVLETLNRQQEELAKSQAEPDQRGNVKRRKTKNVAAHPQYPSAHNPPLSTKSETEWLYSVNQGSNNRFPGAQSKPHVGSISSSEHVRHLVEYAKANGVEISIHQHIHHHYSQNSNTSLGNELTSPGSSTTSGTHILEPEEQISRFQHFNYLPPMTQTPKLNSSTEQSKKNDTTQHHHHHHHHHHHTESGDKTQSQHRAKFTGDADSMKESNLQRLLNAEEYDGVQMASEANPLTPLTRAAEIVRTAANGSTYTAAGDFNNNNNDFSGIQKSFSYGQQANQVSENSEFWKSAKTAPHREIRHHQNGGGGREHSINNRTSSKVGDASHSFGQVTASSQNVLHYPDNSSNGANNRSQYQSGYASHTNNDGEREEDALARELEEAGVDEDVLNSYGLFYNVYTKEGSTFPDAQPNQQPQQQNAYGRDGSSYDQWGSDFIIPFNPS